jgi:predicted GIY-YIG superfamily endonuclease
MGTVYLIHFHTHLSHARHYIGWTEGDDIDARIEKHASGQGACIMRACKEQGITWEVVRTWTGVDRHFERWLKRQRNHKCFCPQCDPWALNKGSPDSPNFHIYRETQLTAKAAEGDKS